MTTMVRAARDEDAAAIAEAYNHYVLHTIVTFEEEPVPADVMRDRVRETQAAGLPFLVAAPDGDVRGFAYASAWKGRCAYRFAREVTIYVRHGDAGRGLGSALYAHMIPQLQQQGFHALLGGIALPNEASIALHEKFGFTKTAHLREVGWKFSRWIDVGYWQRLL